MTVAMKTPSTASSIGRRASRISLPMKKTPAITATTVLRWSTPRMRRLMSKSWAWSTP